jgi:hypothetical protein
MPFFKETDETFVCEKCKREFKSYHYYEDCNNCNDGETDEGKECHACGGMGEHNSIVKDQCQDCLYLYLTNDDW